MTRTGKWIIASTTTVLLAGLLFGSPVLLFMGSNAVIGLYTLLFEKQPTEDQLLGNYEYNADWGTATLQLKARNQFEETIATKDGLVQSNNGTWGYESADMGSAAGITFRPFRPFLDLQNETHGKQYNHGELNFYRPIFGTTYGEIDGDTGARFKKQKK